MLLKTRPRDIRGQQVTIKFGYALVHSWYITEFVKAYHQVKKRDFLVNHHTTF